jgi:hypothetical protein
MSGIWSTIACVLLLVGCRSPATSGASAGSGSARPTAAPGSGPTASSPAPIVSAEAAAQPKLKPISTKVFPDDPSDEVLCAAIHSTETNLWERFGHFLPLYVDGVIWVGDGTDVELKATQAAIADYAPRLIYADGRRCSKGGVLLYAGGWTDAPKEALGKTYDLAELEASVARKSNASEPVLRKHFIATWREGQQQLLRFCAADPDSCEQLLGLYIPHFAPPTRGLCLNVLELAREKLADPDRSWATHPSQKIDEAQIITACDKLHAADKVCATLAPARDPVAKQDCWNALVPKLGL